MQGEGAVQFAHALHHPGGLAHVAHGPDEPGGLAFGAFGVQPLVELLLGFGQNGVGHVQDGLGGAVVALQADHGRAGEDFWKAQDVGHVGAPEGVDGLGVVAHGHDVARGPGDELDQPGLDPVGVLVLVHHDLAEALAQGVAQVFVLQQHPLQLEEQVVVVQQAVGPLDLLVALGDGGHVLGVGQQVHGLPGHQLGQVQLLVAGLGDVLLDGGLLGEGLVALAQAQLLLGHAGQVLGVGLVHDGRAGAQAQGRVLAQLGEGEGVESAAHGVAQAGVEQGLGPGQHFGRGLAGKGQEQDALGVHALLHQVGQPEDDGAGLAAARAGDDQQGAFLVAHGLELAFVEQLFVVDHGAPGYPFSPPLSPRPLHWKKKRQAGAPWAMVRDRLRRSIGEYPWQKAASREHEASQAKRGSRPMSA